MLEHDYLVRKDKDTIELGGVVIGLALNSVYYYRENVGDPQKEVTISDKKLRQEGEKIAEEVAKRIRNMDDLKNIPLTIMLYKQAPKSSIVPGNFIAKTDVKSGTSELGGWDKINEEYTFFPSTEGSEKHPDDAELFKRFKNKVDTYFPNYTGVVGTALYKDDQMQDMKINIPMQFYGKSEVIAFTQFLTGEVMDYYGKSGLNVEININSSAGQEAVILKKPGDKEPTVHIYDS